jgi:hypothetical protein
MTSFLTKSSSSAGINNDSIHMALVDLLGKPAVC